MGFLLAALLAMAQENLKTERFDRDPGWDGRNHRSTAHEPREVRQDFGWSAEAKAVGGTVSPDGDPAYYGKVLPASTLNDPLSASGTMIVGGDARPDGNTLLGFFNAETVNEWRTPSTLAFRVNGRGDGFHLHLEYCTARWRAGADFFGPIEASGKRAFRLFPGGKKAVAWSLRYDPAGDGTVAATVDGETLVLKLDPGHKADGATFNRFGFLNAVKSADSGGPIWIDDLTLNGAVDRFDVDPGWDGRGNRRSYRSVNVRPRFDFGFSPTQHAGGKAEGELGGLVFRGDERYPDKLAYYGDRLETLTLEKPLRASGRVSLRRGVTDSTVLLGFFHATESVRPSERQVSGIPENFLGVAIEGPSREGFLFYPIYGTDREGEGGNAVGAGAPPILPDGKPHDWTLEYSPAGNGRITVSLDGKTVSLELAAAHRKTGSRFNRFGLVTTHIDGNGQQVYFDDLTYTFR